MIVFVDTNVLLDMLAERKPFYAEARAIFALAEDSRITGCVSTLSLPTIFYLLGRSKGKMPAREAMRGLRDIFALVTVDAQIINKAIDTEIPDFEDAIQYYCALRAGADVLITRNPKDFPTTDIVVQTPTEFLAAHLPE